MPSKKRTHIAIRKETKARIDEVCTRLMLAYENGQTEIDFEDQGSRGAWISPDTLINKLIDQYEDHRARSKKSNRNRAQSATTQHNA